MRSLRFIIIVLLQLILVSSGFSQGALPPGQYTTASKKAAKYQDAARHAYEIEKNIASAEKNFLKALEEDPKFVEAALGLASLYQDLGKHSEAVTYYKKAIEINPKFYTKVYYLISKSQLPLGQYEEARNNLETFLKSDRINPNTKDAAEALLPNAVFGAAAIKNPKPYTLVNVGEGVNTVSDEYFPAVTVDGKQFLFTRNASLDPKHPEFIQEDLYISNNEGGIWQPARQVGGINTPYNEGAATLSADGTILFFVACAIEGQYAGGRQGYGSCDIFYAQKINGRWTQPRNAGPAINTSNWETQPSFSSDGKTLYFVRGIVGRGGVRDQDIYTSTIGDDGRFTQAVKISTTVNTPLKEESVFIHPDNQTLYFSSNGHPGMGGLDIYMSKRQPDGGWGPAINLGYPINSFNDENSLLVYPNGKLAFFSSDRKGGYGGLDVYQFELPEDVRPEKITYVKGKIYDARTKGPLEASFELVDLETQKQVTQSYSQKNGEFLVTLTANKNYLVNVSRDGYLFYSDNFSLKDKETDFNKPFLLDIPLEPIDTGSVVELKNVFFDVNKWDLKPESKAELDKLVSFLVKNAGIKIEISGHTDNTGDKKANMLLSANRARSVSDYLVNQGKISAARLSSKGYGDTRPKVPNTTPENKAINRRTEFKVTGK